MVTHYLIQTSHNFWEWWTTLGLELQQDEIFLFFSFLSPPKSKRIKNTCFQSGFFATVHASMTMMFLYCSWSCKVNKILRSKTLIGKLIVNQLAKNFTILKVNCHIHNNPSTSYSHLCMGLLSGFFPLTKILYAFLISHACYMLYPSHLPQFDHLSTNNQWRIKIMTCSSPFCYFPSFRSK
jgi:hypothetical protein